LLCEHSATDFVWTGNQGLVGMPRGFNNQQFEDTASIHR